MCVSACVRMCVYVSGSECRVSWVRVPPKAVHFQVIDMYMHVYMHVYVHVCRNIILVVFTCLT